MVVDFLQKHFIRNAIMQIFASVNLIAQIYAILVKLIQNWYWNNRKKRIEIWLSAIAPLKQETNNMTDIYYNRPLFYRRTDD